MNDSNWTWEAEGLSNVVYSVSTIGLNWTERRCDCYQWISGMRTVYSEPKGSWNSRITVFFYYISAALT